MSTLPNLLGWFFPQRQAESHQTAGLLAEPQHIFANYRHGRAIVESLILPGQGGRVWFKGSWWPARCPLGIPLCQGQAVRVIDIDRITLIVEPITETIPESPPASPDPTAAFTLTVLTESALDANRGPRAQPVSAPPVYPVGYASQ